ncbi:hypothetical protein YC2023_085920 [Brassica napus]
MYNSCKTLSIFLTQVMGVFESLSRIEEPSKCHDQELQIGRRHRLDDVLQCKEGIFWIMVGSSVQ